MARIRSIKIGFFQNEELAALSPHHRLMFAGLWVLADREGRLEDRPKRIEAELFPYEQLDATRLLADLASAGFIQRYRDPRRKYIQVIGFSKHQRPHPKEPPSAIPKPPITAEPCNSTAEPCKKTAEPGGIWDLGSGLGDLGNGDLRKGNGDQSKRASRALVVAATSDFVAFWQAYPKKTGKAAALKAWLKAKPPVAQVLAALAWQTQSLQWNREEGRYRPNPATYLNEGRWQDEPEQPAHQVSDQKSRTGDTVNAARSYLEETLRGKS
jgi:hypothetical protein